MTPDEQRLNLLKFARAKLEARDNLLRYIQMQMVDPDRPGIADATRYDTTPQAIMLCQIMEKVERGEMTRVAVSIGPQLGKSEIITRSAPAWIWNSPHEVVHRQG